MIVNCNRYNCVENIAGECVRHEIYLINDKCQCYIQGESTGEILEEPTAYKNVSTKTAYRTEEEHERD